MKIVIAGSGKVGRSVASLLSEEGNDVTVIDQDADTISSVSNDIDVICVEGNAADPESLRGAGVESADLRKRRGKYGLWNHWTQAGRQTRDCSHP